MTRKEHSDMLARVTGDMDQYRKHLDDHYKSAPQYVTTAFFFMIDAKRKINHDDPFMHLVYMYADYGLREVMYRSAVEELEKGGQN